MRSTTGVIVSPSGRRASGWSRWRSPTAISGNTSTRWWINVRRPDVTPRASGHIPQQIELIEAPSRAGRLRGGGLGVFPRRRVAGYGKLSRGDRRLAIGTRELVRGSKSDPRDFALWKRPSRGTCSAGNALGRRFPGVAHRMLRDGPGIPRRGFDLHAGGTRSPVPHHEAEIAQAEGAVGPSFAKRWMHGNMFTVNGEKMSRSKGISSRSPTFRGARSAPPAVRLRAEPLPIDGRGVAGDASRGGVGPRRLRELRRELVRRIDGSGGGPPDTTRRSSPPRGGARGVRGPWTTISIRPRRSRALFVLARDLRRRSRGPCREGTLLGALELVQGIARGRARAAAARTRRARAERVDRV